MEERRFARQRGVERYFRQQEGLQLKNNADLGKEKESSTHALYVASPNLILRPYQMSSDIYQMSSLSAKPGVSTAQCGPQTNK